MNKIRSIITLIAVLCIAAWTFNITVKICRYVDFSSPSSEGADGVGSFSAPVRLDGRVMSVAEFQEWLKKRDYYKGKIDGKVSDDYINSLTQIAWDNMYNDQCGVADVRAAVATRSQKPEVRIQNGGE